MPSRAEEIAAKGGCPVVHIERRTGKSHFLLYPEIQPDSPSWFAWLDRDSTRRFDLYEWGGYDDECLCHVIRHDGIWFVYRVGEAKSIRRMPLGPNSEVTITALWSAYQTLLSLEVREQGFSTAQFFSPHD